MSSSLWPPFDHVVSPRILPRSVEERAGFLGSELAWFCFGDLLFLAFLVFKWIVLYIYIYVCVSLFGAS